MKYKAVLFDFDDTLVKTASIKWPHHKAVAKKFYDIDLSDEVIAQYWGLPFDSMLAHLYQHRDTPENMLQANLSLEEQFPKELQDDSLAIIEILLQAGVEVGVISSMLGFVVKKDMGRLGFPYDRFVILQGAEDAPLRKPDPGVFNHAIDLLKEKKIAPHETIYVGDALMDYYAARDARLGFMGVTTGFVSQEQFASVGAPSRPTLKGVLSALTVH